ncbi:MAG: hypothetical protein A2297_06290 [Elusimicrobia bacterium RIFOXYB2_FULL_48_7]|nr:MAG: hypothetical protein A2297_06290 [Elusimicrobia bacterium RIFOXYB2_FULL_48_7]
MRLSDIIRKKTGQQPLDAKDVRKEPQFIPSPRAPQEPQTQETEQAPQVQVQDIQKLDSAEQVYSEAIDNVKKFLVNVEKNKLDINPLLNVARKITALAVAGNEELLVLCSHTTPDLYLYSHCANTSILTANLGYAMGYSSDDLEKMTLCALVHDAGMIKIVSISEKPSKISQRDFNEVKKHVAFTKELLNNVNMSPQMRVLVNSVVSQVHERKDGSGYPKGLAGEETNVYAKIIGVADVYEALTHPRAWREATLPHEALKKMIDIAEAEFDINMVKLFIEKISLYPIGSYVRLNSEEIARVVGSNPGMPTRPKLRVIVDSENKRVLGQKFIDLGTNSIFFITEPVDETRLRLTDKKLTLELKAKRWWVKNI